MLSFVGKPMKFFTLLILITTSYSQAATHYFVRHAEKDQSDPTNKNPELSLKGQQRAQNLALMLSEANIKHIHSTAYTRTEQTAQPLSQILDLPVTHYDPRAMDDFLNGLKKSKENTLVVGHSNTTTEAVSFLTKQAMQGLTEKDYGDVFQLIIDGDTMTVNHLKVAPATGKVTQDINTK